MGSPKDECEIKADGKWLNIGIADALLLRNTALLCRECGGRVKAHQNYTVGAKPHFSHFTRHPGCSASSMFDGIQTRHPQALD